MMLLPSDVDGGGSSSSSSPALRSRKHPPRLECWRQLSSGDGGDLGIEFDMPHSQAQAGDIDSSSGSPLCDSIGHCGEDGCGVNEGSDPCSMAFDAMGYDCPLPDCDMLRADEVLEASFSAERLRLSHEFEESYRRRTHAIEAEVRERALRAVREEATVLEAQDAIESRDLKEKGLQTDALEHVENTDRRIRRVRLVLEGEFHQETVLAEELRVTEFSQERQLRDLQQQLNLLQGGFESDLHGRGRVLPTRGPQQSLASLDGEQVEVRRRDEEEATAVSVADLRRELHEERSRAQSLEQKAWQSQNAVRASDAHEELLEAQCEDLLHRVEEAEQAVCQLREAENQASHSLYEALQERTLVALEDRQADLASEAARVAMAEDGARRLSQQLQVKILHLHSECGSMRLTNTIDSDECSEEAQRARLLLQSLVASVTQAPWARESVTPSLDELLEEFEKRHAEVCEQLSAVPNSNRSRTLQWDREQAEALECRVQELQSENRLGQVRLHRLESDAQNLDRENLQAKDRAQDSVTELEELEQENHLLRRQQREWRRSQPRMLQVIQDMQKKKFESDRTQEIATARLMELQRATSTAGSARTTSVKNNGSPHGTLKSSPDGDRAAGCVSRSNAKTSAKMEEVTSENQELQDRIAKLESEKVDLIHSQQGLISFVKSKMPELESALALDREQNQDARHG